MSIPPLVCSTPPPPDQCEEDKDHDDFDIPYNLSQDDDDNDYNFGNFATYSNIQCSVNKNDSVSGEHVEISTSCEVEIPQIETIRTHTTEETHSELNITTPSKLKCEDDNNIEDLELEISDESIETNTKEENEVINGSGLESSISESNIVNEVTENHPETLSHSPSIKDNLVESLNIEKKQVSNEVDVELPDVEDISPEHHTISNRETKQVLSNEALTELEDETINVDDDFGDFDDLQFASTEKQPLPVIDTCSNPWLSNETDDDDFGHFTANFEPTTEIISDSVTETIQTEAQSYEIPNVADDDDDDFGDFDDFKSSAVDYDANVSEDTSPSQGPGINFHLSDNESQLIESISNVLDTIFEEQVTEPVVEFEGKLETMLSETWRHLKETDVRQPYIVNWNNSLGQKTLLKALCIDSRNILFGPKWSYNMPKYAINLNNAPLQPQKPLTPSSSSKSETVSSDKTATKPGGWVDPFTSDGQESCNTESESVVEVTSSDLDVFGPALSTKSDEYPSALNVQPLRQINLPDTHIFTPTDSETPRSKTIHNDTGPPILLPQPVLESTKAVESFPTQTTETSTENNNDDDDDDWEFQDFKCSAGSISTAPQPKEQPVELKSENNSKSNVNYQTQVLQPIKIEPMMPSLNWPDPGEVKETFEGFSDFVSTTSWNNEPSHILSPQERKVTVESDTMEIISGTLTMVEKRETDVRPPQPSSQATGDSFDDEFDTFQSVLPPKNSVGDFATEVLNSNSFNIPNQGQPTQSPSLMKDFDCTFPKSYKSDTISVENTTRPNEALTRSLGFIPAPELTTNKNSLPLVNPMSSDLLQPLPVNSNTTQKHQKTAQILQPLSLESYSQINWPNPGIDLQDLSRFNPVETLQSLKTELSAGGSSKGASPVHAHKNAVTNQAPDEDIWGEFVSSKPKPTVSKKAPVFVDDDEWTDFVSSPSVKPQNGLNTISLNVHTNSNIQKTSNINKFATKNNKVPLDIPTLNYITPKSSGHNSYNERHFQNL